MKTKYGKKAYNNTNRYIGRKKRRVYKARRRLVAKIGRYLPGFPTTTVARLRYVDNFTFTVSSGAMATRSYIANGMYQVPKPPLATHQPIGFDQWMAFYNKAYVLGSKITVQACGDEGDAALPAQWVGIKLDDDSTISGSYITLKEQGCHMRLWQPKSDKKVYVVSKFSAKKWFKSRSIVGNDAYANTSALLPTKLVYFTVFMQSTDQTSSSPTCVFTTTIDFFVRFAEPKDLPAS